MDWSSVLSTGLVVAVFVQTAQIAKEWIFGRRERVRKLQHGSAIISQKLDTFAIACADLVNENSFDQYQGELPENGKMGIPAFPNVLQDIDLDLVNPDILSKLLSIGTFCDLGRSRINFELEVSGRFGAVDESEAQCVIFGFEASRIADDLRMQASLPSPDYKRFGWDFKKFLGDRNAEIIQIRKQREAR